MIGSGSIRRIPRLSSLAAVLLLAFAAPGWSQGVTTEAPRDPPQPKVSKVDAITVKQGTAAAGYLKLGDIRGEAKGEGFKEQVELLSYQWGTQRTGSSITRPASGPGVLTITKPVDKSTPKLMEASTKGKVFSSLTLTLASQRAGGQATTVTLENVSVASVRRSSAGGRPTESISFNYERIK